MEGTMLLTPPNKHLIGHRGSSRSKPENTILSFQTAIAHGLNWLELDAQPTKCGQWACIHDNTLQRTTNGNGLVIEHTLAQLQHLEAGLWFTPPMHGIRIPSIKEVVSFARFNKVTINIEIKDTNANTKFFVQNFIAYLGLTNLPHSFANILISSFELNFIIELRKLLPAIPIAYLVEYITEDSFSLVQQHNFQMLNSDITTFTHEQLQIAQQRNIPISLYTCNDKQLALSWLTRGVFSLFTDIPTLLDNKLQEYTIYDRIKP
jgi:glycerophosphoryl diester phosphodiesterase